MISKDQTIEGNQTDRDNRELFGGIFIFERDKHLNKKGQIDLTQPALESTFQLVSLLSLILLRAFSFQLP